VPKGVCDVICFSTGTARSFVELSESLMISLLTESRLRDAWLSVSLFFSKNESGWIAAPEQPSIRPSDQYWFRQVSAEGMSSGSLL
jgi:hypothetical protein